MRKWLIGAALATAILPAVALTQTTNTSGTTQAEPPSQTVTVVGKKRGIFTDDPRVLNLQPDRGSSCAFMDDYNPAYDDVTQGYYRGFNGENSPSNPAERFRDTAPGSNVTADLPEMGGLANPTTATTDMDNPTGCDVTERNFAAGRNFIARKDTLLKEAYEAFDAKEYEKAFGLFEKAYEKVGYESAAFMLGKMHLYGIGTKPSTSEGVKWLRKVAEVRFVPGKDNHPFDPTDPDFMNTRADAIMTLAKVYHIGFNTPVNLPEARKWYEKAAEIGYVPAWFIMGEIWQNGFAGPRDMKKAVEYYTRAGEVSYAPAQYALGVIYETGEGGIPADAKKSLAWYYEAAKNGDPDALYIVGRAYDLGEGLPADPQKAIVFYKEAAVKGQPDAISAMATYFYTGEMVEKDLPLARRMFEQAAMGGQVDAMFNLAVMLMNGEGGPKDMAMAYVWFTLASQLGLEKAAQAATVVEKKLTPDERAKADAILKP